MFDNTLKEGELVSTSQFQNYSEAQNNRFKIQVRYHRKIEGKSKRENYNVKN